MGCGSNRGRWRRCLPATFLMVVTKQLREQLKEGRIYLGSQFEGAVHLWLGKHGGRSRGWSYGIDAVRTVCCYLAHFPLSTVQAPVSRWWGLPAFRIYLPSLVKDSHRQTCPEVCLLGDSGPRQLKTNYHQEENILWIQIFFPYMVLQHVLKVFIWFFWNFLYGIKKSDETYLNSTV